jgi:hypothetical protein
MQDFSSRSRSLQDWLLRGLMQDSPSNAIPFWYFWPLLLNGPFVITVSGEKLLLFRAIPTQRFTVITLPWKGLLQTRYSMNQRQYGEGTQDGLRLIIRVLTQPIRFGHIFQGSTTARPNEGALRYMSDKTTFYKDIYIYIYIHIAALVFKLRCGYSPVYNGKVVPGLK